MRILRKLTPIAFVIGAVTAIGASAAPAATVTAEATGATCTAITETFTATPSKTEISGGCAFQGSTPAGAPMEFGGPFGVMITCPVYMEGRVSGNGHMIAAIYLVGGNDRLATLPPNGGTTTCTQNWAVPCDTERDFVPSGEVHTELQVTTTITKSTKWNLERNWCVKTYLGNTIDCHIQGSITELAGHNYDVLFNHATSPCENAAGYSLQGTIHLVPDAAHPKIEING